MIILDLILSAVMGGLLHQTRRYTNHLPYGWRELTNYTVGVAGTGPVFLLWWARLKDMTSLNNRAFLSYILSFIGVGSGVAIAWMIDTFQHEEKK
jgi:hypothetical protein